MSDLFGNTAKKTNVKTYNAQDIEVLEGLEPVRRRPGMYIGGTDERALHHLVAEVLDNAMDEAVAGYASRIEITLLADNSIKIRDNGRGIPIDEHPRYPGKSALEVILTTLHSGGKFNQNVYQTSGGLHGVGISVVNALSAWLRVEIARDKKLYAQDYQRGLAVNSLTEIGNSKERGTSICFSPDPEIFGEQIKFKPERLYRMARSKAYLFKGVEIYWNCAKELLPPDTQIPENEIIHFPGGLQDFILSNIGNRKSITHKPFYGTSEFHGAIGRVEWAIAWPQDGDGLVHSYCNTIPTPQGGMHENGFRAALLRGCKAYAELSNNKKASIITSDDILEGAVLALSVFIVDPQFQGQTKEKLTSVEASRLVENTVKDHVEHWLTSDPNAAKLLLEHFINNAEERLRKRDAKETARKTATRKLRLPGKLADCSRQTAENTEIFIVEGDSAGGSAKQARHRETQAILPLRGKILNVASATQDKLKQNQELSDLILALGCGAGKDFNIDKLRYERVIIMTDADVDGAHIAALLITFFYREMRGLIESGSLFLAMPPLYRLNQGNKSYYARDDKEKEELLAKLGKQRGKVEISRFKGLGEMPASQLKETTMDPGKRILQRVRLPDINNPDQADDWQFTATLVEQLMGRSAESRFNFITENAKFVSDLDL